MSEISTVTKTILPAAEWVADNAYVAPGFHRLFAAGGLSIGLWGGRHTMDLITARRASDGSVIQDDQVPHLLHPLHGAMSYNPYSDAASDRWKSVADHLAPLAFGAVGAYWGSKGFFYGKIPALIDYQRSGKSLFHAWKPVTIAPNKAIENYGNGSHSLETMVGMSSVSQGDGISKAASGMFGVGSSAGGHLLGGLFPYSNSLTVWRFLVSNFRKISVPGMPALNRFFGNNGSSPRDLWGSAREAIKWMETNIQNHPDLAWADEEALRYHARELLQVYDHPTDAQVGSLAQEMGALVKAGAAEWGKSQDTKALYAFLSGGKDKVGLLGMGQEALFHKAGLKLDAIQTKTNGAFTTFARLFGSEKDERKIWEAYAEHLKKNYPSQYGSINPQAWAAAQVPDVEGMKYGAYAVAGVIGASTLGAAANTIAHQRDSARDTPLKPQTDRSADRYGARPAPQGGVWHASDPHTELPPTVLPAKPNAPLHKHGTLIDWVNGKPLDAMEWASRVAIVPPSMHRLMNAACFSGALWGSMHLTNVLTGRQLQLIRTGPLTNAAIPKEKVWKALQPLHGLLAYTPGDVSIQSRWRQAAHFLIPAITGVVGTYWGSKLYFHDRTQALNAPDTLEEYADRIALEQSKPYGAATALTSMFSASSGIGLLPFVNYSSNLHNRYLLASGQQVALPGLGKWWSGNAGSTPWGVKHTLEYASNYLTFNPDARLKELPALLDSVIGKLYPSLPEGERFAHRQTMLDSIYAQRDGFVTEGKVDASRQAELHTAMHELLKGKGFEALLLQSGLDPQQANLMNNGASGKIANALGSGKTVRHLQEEYRGKFADRLARHEIKTTADVVMEHGRSLNPAENDNRLQPANSNTSKSPISAPASFRERVKAQQETQQAEGVSSHRDGRS